jgi:hypothetical protein
MKPLPWFRLYSEFANDPKVQSMTEPMQRRLLMLMCFQCNGTLATLSDEDLAFALRVDDEQLAATKSLFIRKGFIDDAWLLLNWDKRQCRSDHDPTGAERKRRQREREKQVQADVTRDMPVTSRMDHAPVTLPEERRGEESNTSAYAECATGEASSPAPRLPDCPHQSIIDAYARHLPMLTQPRTWEGNRQKLTRSRWQWVLTSRKPDGSRRAETAEQALSYFDTFFAHVAESDWLTGRTGKWARCNLEWLMTAGNFAKVIDGNYHDQKAAA